MIYLFFDVLTGVAMVGGGQASFPSPRRCRGGAEGRQTFRPVRARMAEVLSVLRPAAVPFASAQPCPWLPWASPRGHAVSPPGPPLGRRKVPPPAPIVSTPLVRMCLPCHGSVVREPCPGDDRRFLGERISNPFPVLAPCLAPKARPDLCSNLC